MNATITLNGKTLTAPTKRNYTHAVVLEAEDGRVFERGWCGSLALAEKQARKESRPYMGTPAPSGHYYIVEVATNDATLYAAI